MEEGLHADAEGLVVAVDSGPVGGLRPSRGLRHQIPPVNPAAAVANAMRPVERLGSLAQLRTPVRQSAWAGVTKRRQRRSMSARLRPSRPTFGTTIRISHLHHPSCMSWRAGDLRFN